MMLLWLCIGWVFSSAAVAMLPMRYQYLPGTALLIAAAVLVAMIWMQVAPWAALLALAGVVSMFRNPLRYLWARVLGRSSERPE